MYRTRLGQTVDPFGGVGVPTSAAEQWGKAVGAVVGATAEILKTTRQPPAPAYFAPPPPVRVALPTPAPAGLPGWLLPVGLAAAGGAALWFMMRGR